MDERKAFIAAWKRKEQSFTALCRIFGVSRPTGYKWLERYQSDGETALADLSRAPLFQPRAMPKLCAAVFSSCAPNILPGDPRS